MDNIMMARPFVLRSNTWTDGILSCGLANYVDVNILVCLNITHIVTCGSIVQRGKNAGKKSSGETDIWQTGDKPFN